MEIIKKIQVEQQESLRKYSETLKYPDGKNPKTDDVFWVIVKYAQEYKLVPGTFMGIDGSKKWLLKTALSTNGEPFIVAGVFNVNTFEKFSIAGETYRKDFAKRNKINALESVEPNLIPTCLNCKNKATYMSFDGTVSYQYCSYWRHITQLAWPLTNICPSYTEMEMGQYKYHSYIDYVKGENINPNDDMIFKVYFYTKTSIFTLYIRVWREAWNLGNLWKYSYTNDRASFFAQKMEMKCVGSGINHTKYFNRTMNREMVVDEIKKWDANLTDSV